MKLAAERHEAILRAARLRGSVRVTELSQRLGVSPVTIRRDVSALVDRGDLERVHGGATLPAQRSEVRTGQPAGRRQSPRATIGMVVPSAQYYYPRVIQGAEAAAGAQGVRLILAISHYYPAEDRRQVERLIELGVDALLLTTSDSPDESAETTSWAGGLPVPTVLVERQTEFPEGPAIEHVRTDHVAGARLALHHLGTLGHQRIALAARRGSPTAPWLVRGHQQWIATNSGAAASPPPILLPRPDNGLEDRGRALTDLIDTCFANQTRAVLVHTDEDAIELTRVAAARGLRVPQDLALVAYDDEVAALADVPLTAVAPPKLDVGRAAVQMALRRLTAGAGAAAQQLTLLPTLVVRSSSGVPAPG